MEKQFLKITANTAVKNKLQEAVKREIGNIDMTLYPTLKKAKDSVYEAFDKALKSYTGRCEVSRPYGSHTSTDGSVYTFWIAEIITLSIYQVKKDLS